MLNEYFTNAALEKTILTWQKEYPELLDVSVIGESYEKRPIWLLTLTQKKTGLAEEKPAIWIDANIHATEITGTTVALNVAYTLLHEYAQKPEIHRLLDNAVYYIVPRVNPDGAEAVLSKNPRLLRSGVRPYPYIDKEEGLHIQDVDGDGRILQMRLKDPNGDWKAHPEFPDLLVKRQPADLEGEFFRLFREGLLEYFDGYLIKSARPIAGLDFNRNFPFEWKPEGDQTGAGPFPGSEPEIHALLNFITSHANINLALTYHTFSRVILRPFSTRPDDQMETSDLWVYKKIGALGTHFTGYRSVSTYHDFLYHPKEVTTGAFDDWMYDHLGIFAFTVELWDLPTEAGIENRGFAEWFREHPVEDDEKIFTWIKQHTGDQGYVPWYPFDHPQLGKIELGGWNSLFTWTNPPAAYLEAEITRNVPFAIEIGKLLPQIEIKTLRVSPLGEDAFSIHLVVENKGYLPTYTSAQGKKRAITRPLRVKLILPDEVSLIEGKLQPELGFLEGRANKSMSTAVFASSPTDNRAWAAWVVRGKSGSRLQVDLFGERGGTIHHEIVLP
jgi:murein tripeptide amidase MpaA